MACQVIAFGRGVCGAAAASGETQLVGDVDSFPGHIACDGDSKSEIVVPIVVDEKVSLLSLPRVMTDQVTRELTISYRLWQSSTSTVR